MAVVGRYILIGKIFKYSRKFTAKMLVERVQLTDAIKLMLADEQVCGILYEGQKFDCGSKARIRAGHSDILHPDS